MTAFKQDGQNEYPMNEQRAREILGNIVGPDAMLLGFLHTTEEVAWTKSNSYCELEGAVTPDELEAIAWWMRNMPPSFGEPGMWACENLSSNTDTGESI